MRFQDSLGQVAADLRYCVPDVVHRPVGRSPQLECDEGEAAALADVAVDLVNAVHAPDGRFDTLRDLGLDLVRCGARLRNLDDGRGEVDVRRVVHLHPVECDEPRQHEADEQNDRKDRVADAPG